MATLIKLQFSEDIPTPSEGYAVVFYTRQDGMLVKKLKLSDGSVLPISTAPSVQETAEE